LSGGSDEDGANEQQISHREDYSLLPGWSAARYCLSADEFVKASQWKWSAHRMIGLRAYRNQAVAFNPGSCYLATRRLHMNDTKGTSTTTDRIEKKVLLRAPRSKVWRAISDSAEFGTWFGMKVDGPFVPGKKMRGVIVPTKVDAEVAKMQKPYEGKEFELQIEKIEPERLFSFRWHPYAVERDVDYSAEPTTLIVFQLDDVEGGVMLTVTESGFDQIPLARRAKAFQANEGGWGKQMELIKAYVTGAYSGDPDTGTKATGAR
jgi:uncharacterized protein YndB with AHSA1/START domain